MAEFGESLSDRELEVLERVVEGLSNKEIAGSLHISQNTVKVHLRNIYTKLGTTSRTEAATAALQQGIITLPGTDTPPPTLNSPEGDEETAVSPATPVPNIPSRPARSWRSRALFAFLGVIIIGLLGIVGFQAVNAPTVEPTPTPFVERPVGQSPWSESTPMETAVAGMAVAAVGLDIYQIGGETSSGTVGTMNIFDTSTNTWQAGSDKPTAVAGATAAVLFGEIIVPGGQRGDGTATAVVEAYSPAQQAWRQLTPLPQPAAGGLTLSDGSFIYLFGGINNGTYMNTTYLYDPAADSWRPLSPMPTPRAYAAGAIVANRLYVVGGQNEDGPLAICEQYDPIADTWSPCATMLQPRISASAAVVVNKLYVIGGNAGTGTEPSYSEVYDPNTGTWQVLNMPLFDDERPWRQLGAANVETRIYALGGRQGDTLLNNNFIYTPFIYTTYIPAAAAENDE